MLLSAFHSMNCENCQLLLIGKGSLEEKLKQKVLSLGIQERVVFLGYQDNPFKYISRSDCFVFPSDFEGFPNVLIEALACGAPVISTDCQSGPRELLAPETDFRKQNIDSLEIADFGILVPVGNEKIMAQAMCEIKQNEILRNSFVKKAVIRAADYDGKTVVEDFKEFILEIYQSS